MSTVQERVREPRNAITGLCYKGRNVSTLAGAGYSEPEWATFIQWREAGYNIRKGEHGERIMTFNPTTRPDKDGKIVESTAVRCYVVFNREQVEKV